MTLEQALAIPVGSRVIFKGKEGILLAHNERSTTGKGDQVPVLVAFYNEKRSDYKDLVTMTVSPESLEPYGEMDAVKKLIEFAGRLLQDSPATIGRSEEEELKEAIDICEGAYNL